jgi:hypothetical protein
MPAKGSMQVYRARNPKKSPLWQCAQRQKKEIPFAKARKPGLIGFDKSERFWQTTNCYL